VNDDKRPNLLCGDGRGLANLRVGLQLGEYIESKTFTDFDERLKRLEAAVKKRSTEIETQDEALCLYSEVVCLYQKHEIVRPKEVDSLLARIKVLTEQK